MDIAALIVSALALLVALASVVYVRQQATATKAIAQHDRERRLEETRPRLTAIAHDDDTWQRIAVANDGPHDIDELVLRQLSPRVKEADTGTLVDTGDGTRASEINLGPVAVGGEVAARYQLNSDPGRGSTARFHAICRRGSDIWTVPLEIDYPSTPQVW